MTRSYIELELDRTGELVRKIIIIHMSTHCSDLSSNLDGHLNLGYLSSHYSGPVCVIILSELSVRSKNENDLFGSR